MTLSWNVLVVDDDADIHDVTDLALRRKSYRGRPFQLLHAASAAEARAVLASPAGRALHVALVDVVMETDRAGLDLCEHIRSQMPDSLRIILRTGQPGIAPEEAVMNEYDIDTYLAKANLTSELLHTALRAACRSSVDVATATALADQLREYIEALQSSATGTSELTRIMNKGLDYLETKHDVLLAFVDFTDETVRHGLDAARLRRALTDAAHADAGPVVEGESCGLTADELLLLLTSLQVAPDKKPDGMLNRVARWLLGPGSESHRVPSVTGAVYARHADGKLGAKARSDLVRDLHRFMEGWRVAMSMLGMRERIVHERMVAIEAAADGYQ